MLKIYRLISRDLANNKYPHVRFTLVATIIAVFFSKKRWYKVLVFITAFTKFKLLVKRKQNMSLRFLQAVQVNAILSLLTRTKKPFPIAYNIDGTDALSHTSGLIICTVHLPLIKVGIRAVLDQKYIIDAAIVAESLPDNQIGFWGITQKVPAFSRDRFVLLKAKSILNKNGVILLMIDNGDNSYYSPNVMHLCQLTKSKVVFLFAELNREGVVDVNIVNAPFPHCETPHQIEKNIDFMKQKTEEIKQRYRK
jgi:hypothetical protein